MLVGSEDVAGIQLSIMWRKGEALCVLHLCHVGIHIRLGLAKKHSAAREMQLYTRVGRFFWRMSYRVRWASFSRLAHLHTSCYGIARNCNCEN